MRRQTREEFEDALDETAAGMIAHCICRFVGIINDRANVLIAYPILAAIDWAGAKCCQWEHSEKRSESVEFLLKVWDRKTDQNRWTKYNDCRFSNLAVKEALDTIKEDELQELEELNEKRRLYL